MNTDPMPPFAGASPAVTSEEFPNMSESNSPPSGYSPAVMPVELHKIFAWHGPTDIPVPSRFQEMLEFHPPSPLVESFPESHSPSISIPMSSESPPEESFLESHRPSISTQHHVWEEPRSHRKSSINRPKGLENLTIRMRPLSPCLPPERKQRRLPRIIYATGSRGDFRSVVQRLTGVAENISPFQETFTRPIPEDLSPFISYCCFIPLGYEFNKEDLVALWIAEGLVPVARSCRLEDVADQIFNSLVSEGLIVPSRLDKTVDYLNPRVRKPLYKVYESMPLLSGHARVSEGNMSHVPETVLHLSIQCENFDQIEVSFKALKRFRHLRTLFFIPFSGFCVERIPSDLFLWLKHLRSLNLSRSLLSELPNSIGSLKSLRHIDLSYTPIKQLPDTIDTLQELRTIKLRCCLNLVGLPKGMRKLTNLRHLDVDVMRQIKHMPPGMGNLVELQTLSAFLVGRNDGYGIGELKNMMNLTGACCISGLENVPDFEVAKEAVLFNKKFVKKLELRWTDNMRVGNYVEEEKILEHLQPPLVLEELRVLNYGGCKFPSWIENRSYGFLFDITLSRCRNCELLPSLGELPSLQFLHINEMNDLKIIDDRFCRQGRDQQYRAFPRLEKLTIEVMPELVEWIGIRNGDFPCLQILKVEHCPKLRSLPLQTPFYSLKHLELCYCPNIMSLPDQDVTVSLAYLLIKDCPKLKQRCHKGEGEDWEKIARVPNILIDDEKIT